MFAYAANRSCIALLISGACSESFKIYFLLPLVHFFEQLHFLLPLQNLPVLYPVFEHILLLYVFSNHCWQGRKIVQMFSWQLQKYIGIVP